MRAITLRNVLATKGYALKAGRAAVVNKAEDEVSHFLSALVLLMKDCVGKDNGRVRTSANNHSRTIMGIISRVGNELQDTGCGQSVRDDSPLDVGVVIPSGDLLFLPWIDAAPNGGSTAVLTCDEIQPASSSRSKKDSMTSPKSSTKRRRTSTMQSRLDAAKEFSEDMPVIDLESEGE